MSGPIPGPASGPVDKPASGPVDNPARVPVDHPAHGNADPPAGAAISTLPLSPALPLRYLALPGWVLWLAGLALIMVLAFFLAGLIATLREPLEAGVLAHLPMEGAGKLTWHSVVFSLLATSVSLLVALPAALHLRARPALRWPLIAMVAGVATVPWIVGATGWTQSWALMGSLGAAGERFIKHSGDDAEFLRLLMAAFVQGAIGAPLALLALSALLPEQTHEEEAALLSGGRWQVFRHVTWPSCRAPVLVGALILLLWQFNELTVCDLMRVSTWSTRIFITTAGLSLPMAMREYLWMAVLNGLCAVALLMLLVRVAQRRAAERIEHDPIVSAPLTPPRWFVLGGWGLIAILGIGWPLGVLVARLATSPDATLQSVMACIKVYSSAWVQSAEIGLAAGVLVMVFGTGFGLLCVCDEPMLRWPAWGLAAFLLALSAIGVTLPIKALSQHLTWISGLRDAHFYDVLACTARALPWCMLMTVWHLYHLPRRWDEAARADGAGPGAIFRYLLAPYVLPILPLGFFLGFALASLDLVPAVLLAPPGRQSLIVALFNELHYDYNANLVVMALMIALPLPILAAPLFWKIGRTSRLNRFTEAPARQASPTQPASPPNKD